MIGRIPILDVSPPWTAAAGRPRRSSARPSRSRRPSSARATTRSPRTSCCATRRARKGPFTPMRRARPGHRPLGGRGHADQRGPLDVRGRGVERPGRAPGTTTPRSRSPPAIDVELMLEEGARLLERAAAGVPQRGRRAPALLDAADGPARRRRARSPARLAAADVARRRAPTLDRAPAARLVTASEPAAAAGSTASARCTAPGTSSSRAPRAPRRTPTACCGQRHLPDGRRAAARRRRDGLRRRLPAADPPDRHAPTARAPTTP